MQRKISLLSCILLMFSAFFSQGNFAYALDSSSTENNEESISYYFIHYDGTEQEIVINENAKLILAGWTDESKSSANGKIEFQNDMSEPQKDIILDITDELNQIGLTDNESIHYRLAISDSFEVEEVEPVELNNQVTVVAENENGTSIEEVKTTDEYATVINKELTYYSTDENGKKKESTKEEYDNLNSVEDKQDIDKPSSEDMQEIEESTEVEKDSEDKADKDSTKVMARSSMAMNVANPSITYTTHVQGSGWIDPVSNGEPSGSTGKGKRLESIKIDLENSPFSGGITYSTHIQSKGWLNSVSNGIQSGTTGKGKRMEAIKIDLTGDIAKHYDVYYRVHSQTFGWLDWAKNGQEAGTEGLAKRLEAIEIKLVKKGEKAPGSTDEPFLTAPSVSYSTHVQSHGWMDLVKNGAMSGTKGEAKRLESIKIDIQDSPYSGDITYSTHVQGKGWLPSVSNNDPSGTTGQGKRMEAIKISLTGDIAKHYDIYYRAHAQTFGWLDWARNGEEAGTAGLSKRLEAIEIVLVKKGGKAPGSTAEPFVTGLSVNYSTHVQTYGWMDFVADGEMSGTTGKAKRLEAIKIDLEDAPYSGGISYSTHVQSKGWLNNVSNGAPSGTSGESKRMEAIKINLTGEIAKHYDVYYRVHVQSFGWLGWAKNGMEAGSQGLSKRLESIEIKLVNKDKGATVNKDDAFKKIATVVNYTNYATDFSNMINKQMSITPISDRPKADGAGLLFASREFVAYYANPNNFSQDSSSYLQFLNLSKPAGSSATNLNNKVLNDKGVFSGKAQAFIDASKKYNINEVYLISHALHETGNGSSILSNGTIEVGEVSSNKWVSFQPNGTFIVECKPTSSGGCTWKVTEDKTFNRDEAKNIKKTYNVFGIGAVDKDPNILGSVRAYRENWFNVSDAIIGGSQFIANGYINQGQNTLYKMRWNPTSPATHQYATHVAWAESQTNRMAEIYNLLDAYVLNFDVPKFKNQPAASSKPTGDAQYDLDRTLEGEIGITTARLNFRSGPKTSYSVVKTLPISSQVTIIGKNGGWYKVHVDGDTGWVSGDYIQLKKNMKMSVFSILTEPQPSTSEEEKVTNGETVIKEGNLFRNEFYRFMD
ncbi:SH3 domain-containing protein [Oceanobacillus bengalensis]|nr:SH3 domain-containing protein [Oceanobacillus bengalensis]